MTRRLIAAVLSLLMACGAADALSGPRRVLLFGGKHSQPIIPNTMSLDGSGGNNVISSAIATDITTTKPNDVIIAMVLTNGGPITSVTGETLGAFTKRSTAGALPNSVEEWYAISPGVLTAESITAIPTSTGFLTLIIFAVNGAKMSAPFDINAALPDAGTTDPATVSTTGPNTMVLGAFRMSTGSPTAGAGYTSIAPVAGGFMLVEYQLASSPQSNLSVTVGTGAGTTNGAIGDAIVQGP